MNTFRRLLLGWALLGLVLCGGLFIKDQAVQMERPGYTGEVYGHRKFYWIVGGASLFMLVTSWAIPSAKQERDSGSADRTNGVELEEGEPRV